MLDKLMDLLPIVSCHEATRLASLAMERRLSLKETVDLKIHLMVCSLCQEFQKQVQGLRGLLRQYKPQHEKFLSQEQKNQIKKSLQG